MKKCKKCGYVELTPAKSCPRCHSSYSSRWRAWFFCILIASLLVAVFGNPSSKKNTEDKPERHVASSTRNDSQVSDDEVLHKAFAVVRVEDFSYAGRKRVRGVIISPESQTADERVATVKRAAIDLQRSERANFVDVWLMPTANAAGGTQLAIASYSPDGCGAGDECNGKKWDIKASNLALSEQQIKIIDLWFSSKSKFAGADGILNLSEENRLKKSISKQMKIPLSDVTIPDFISSLNVIQ